MPPSPNGRPLYHGRVYRLIAALLAAVALAGGLSAVRPLSARADGVPGLASPDQVVYLNSITYDDYRHSEPDCGHHPEDPESGRPEFEYCMVDYAGVVIDGLKDQAVEDKINSTTWDDLTAYRYSGGNYKYTYNTSSGLYVNYDFTYDNYVSGNFANVISVPMTYVTGSVARWGPGLNFRLDTGDELAFSDLFMPGTDILGLIESLDPCAADRVLDPEACLDDIRESYRANPNPAFAFDDRRLTFWLDGLSSIQLDWVDHWQAVAVFTRFAGAGDLYTQPAIGCTSPSRWNRESRSCSPPQAPSESPSPSPAAPTDAVASATASQASSPTASPGPFESPGPSAPPGSASADDSFPPTISTSTATVANSSSLTSTSPSGSSISPSPSAAPPASAPTDGHSPDTSFAPPSQALMSWPPGSPSPVSGTLPHTSATAAPSVVVAAVLMVLAGLVCCLSLTRLRQPVRTPHD
ncbi:MAG: hypothetical protein LBK42_10805 [Propionibacteriaceae bacterium]|jgi:hypothetical protein|nr:hypothetical protein [Propionibacteriaceae bacterium]